MANGIRKGDPRVFNKGHSSKFREGSQVRQTHEEGRRTYRPKRCGNNHKDKTIVRKHLMIKIINNGTNILSCLRSITCGNTTGNSVYLICIFLSKKYDLVHHI